MFRPATALVSLMELLVTIAFAVGRPQAQQTQVELQGASVAVISPASFGWQRAVVPPANPLAEACVVLDAETFRIAAPALRDLRLYQDGAELPFVIEQSFDERALASGVTPPDDRSLYEPSAILNLKPRPVAGVAGEGLPRNSRTHLPLRPGEVDLGGGFYSIGLLYAHVPVERIRVLPAPLQLEKLFVYARESTGPQPGPSESMEATIGPDRPALPFTLGANLQNAAEVTVVVDGVAVQPRQAVLEMRRRSLCYQPRSASPLTLYLGGGNAMPAESYAFARSFQSTRDRPYGRLGPVLPNPLYRPVAPRRSAVSHGTTVVLALFALLLFNMQRLFRKYRRSAPPPRTAV